MRSIWLRMGNRGAGLRMCALAFIFLYGIGIGMKNGAWAQQPAQNSGTAPSSTAAPAATAQAPADGAQATPAKPDATPAPAPESTKTENEGKAAPPGPSLPPTGYDPVKRMPYYEEIQEDWSSLSVGASQLTPEPPLEAETGDGDGYTRSLLQLKWRPGDPLDLYVILPKGVKNPPAVLYLFGYKDDTDRFRDNGWCQRATKGGVAAIGFVSALSASRFHDRPMRQWFVSELQESLGSTVHDVKFILDYLAQRGDINMNRIGMFGQASGGTIAILSAAADPRIKAVDALDPWGDWPVWLEKSWVAQIDPDYKNFSKPEFLAKVAPLDPVKWLPTLKSTRVRIQQVMENTATPDACKDAIKKAALKRAQVVRYEHTSQFAEVASRGGLFEWVKMQVKTLPAPGVQKRTAVAERVAPPSNKSSSAGAQR